MKTYHLHRTQFLPIPIAEAWDFFSSPNNLLKITPAHMGFKVLYNSGDNKMYPGQIICYSINIFPAVKTNWTTEITHVSDLHYFVDEQRFGPYAMWHHEHHFREVKGGIEMTDKISYAIPLGIFGRIANWLFVGKQVKGIFDYRYQLLEKYFINNQ